MRFNADLLDGRSVDLGRDEWWKGAVVYQIYPRSFQDSNGDGIGDLDGIRSRLDYLEALGVDVLWLSPIYASPQADNGYDISDYRAIDPMFGTLEDFDRLLSAVHERGMKLVMDLVVNHTSDEHEWFRESRSSIDAKTRGWYIWRPAKPGFEPGAPGAEPNNWGSFFSGPAWTFDELTGEYYLHLFHSKQPDLNWENAEVRRAVYAMMNWWLDRGVDGFRMDVISFISKAAGLPDGERLPDRPYGDGFPFYSEGPRVHGFLAEMRREVFDGRGGAQRDADAPMTVGETPGVRRDRVLRYTAEERRELDMVFEFDHVGLGLERGKFHPRPLAPGELADSLSEWQEAQAEAGWNALYLDNHDQPRAVSRFGDATRRYESATALATALHLLRGTPYVYQGEELGMTNSVFMTVEDFRDVEAIRYFDESVGGGEDPESVLEGLRLMARDNARTPVQWSAKEPNAGFTRGVPWIAVNPNYSEINAESQIDEPNSVFAYYAALIRMRHALPVVVLGDYERLDAGAPEVFAYRRRLGDEQLIVVVNLSDRTVEARVDAGAFEGMVEILSNADAPRAAAAAAALAPWEARVLLGRS